MFRLARTPLFALLLVAAPLAGAPPSRSVYVASGLSDEQLLSFFTTLATPSRGGVALLDSPAAAPYLRAFLDAEKPGAVVPVLAAAADHDLVQCRLGRWTDAPVVWPHGRPHALWQRVLPELPRAVVVCPAEPRELLLQGATLAGHLPAALFITHGQKDDLPELTERLEKWQSREVFLLGDHARLVSGIRAASVVPLADAMAVADRSLRLLTQRGPVRDLVVCNPADVARGLEGMSTFAPALAVRRGAALLFTRPAGDDVEAVVRAALARPELATADTLILAGGLKAIPVLTRPNPIPDDKDAVIEMEPLTPPGREPFSFATGRVFHEDPAVVALMLARAALLESTPEPRALVASNPGNSLPLMEVFSRCTALELRNLGYETSALFGSQVTREELRRRLPKSEVFLWEGHHNTLVKEWEFPTWDEPLPPSFVFLQSCLALHDWKAQPLLRRGAVAVLGSSTRTYSGSGGAFSFAFFNAAMHDRLPVGAAARQAKNYLLCYALLKEKRLGAAAKLTGANLRSSWAFTLWGDPGLRLPRPTRPPDALPPVRSIVRGNSLSLIVPTDTLGRVTSANYVVDVPPNIRLAGLLRKGEDEDERELTPLVFAEVSLPNVPVGQKPRLTGRLPSNNWVFTWDDRRRVGYLLALPRPKDGPELRFTIDCQPR